MERRSGSRTTGLDRASVVVIVLTFALFAAALAAKGLNHDILLEAGVLLVSVKLILNGFYMDAHVGRLEARIDELKTLLLRTADASPSPERKQA